MHPLRRTHAVLSSPTQPLAGLVASGGAVVDAVVPGVVPSVVDPLVQLAEVAPMTMRSEIANACASFTILTVASPGDDHLAVQAAERNCFARIRCLYA